MCHRSELCQLQICNSENVVTNCDLTKSQQKSYFWTFCDHNEGIGGSRRATEILILFFKSKIERIF
jgi:hypothetical protein